MGDDEKGRQLHPWIVPALLLAILGALLWIGTIQHLERARDIAVSKCYDNDRIYDERTCDYRGERISDPDDEEPASFDE